MRGFIFSQARRAARGWLGGSEIFRSIFQTRLGSKKIFPLGLPPHICPFAFQLVSDLFNQNVSSQVNVTK